MRKIIIVALSLVLVCFVLQNNNQASWFGLGSSKNSQSIDTNLANFLTFYDDHLNKYKDTEDILQYRELFVNAYDLLIDYYVHELSNKEIQVILLAAKDAMLTKEKALENAKQKITAQELTYAALSAMYSSVDPHTEWLSPKEYQSLKDSINGEYEGVGIALGIEKGSRYIKAISVVEGGPADKAGLKAGDYIIKVNGKAFSAKQISIAARLLKGKKGTTVNVVVKRGKKEKSFVIQRGEVYLKSVYTKVIDNKYAYIKITNFNSKTTGEFRDALRKLDINKKEGLIIDLRGNPGGLLNSSINIANIFINKGVLLKVKGRNPDFDMSYYALNMKDIDTKTPIIVLVNNMTASAAEILSAALSQTNRAIIMGQPSFGKGSVQEVFNLKDGSAAKITIQLFYTPNGTALQGIGVVPNIELIPVHKNYFYNIRETSYKNYLKVDHPKMLNSNIAKAIDAKTCKRDAMDNDYEVGCAIEAFKKHNTIISNEKKISKK